MKVSEQSRTAGFAVVETVLVLIIVAAIVGVGLYVVRQRQNTSSTLSSNSGATSVKAPSGTTSNIDQLTQQEAQAETSADQGSDTQVQQNATSANGAISNVGGAYNEANL